MNIPIKRDDSRWWFTASCGHENSYSSQSNAKQAIKNNRKCLSCSRLPENNPMYGKVGPLNGFYGKSHSNETKDLLSKKANDRVRTPEELQQARESLALVSNRRPIYDIWCEKYGTSRANEMMSDLKMRKSKNTSGENNPMYGKPAPPGSGVGWKGWFNGTHFRSLRELKFLLENPTYESAECAEWTAKYTSWNGSSRTTRPDFVNRGLKVLVECKPERLHNTPLVSLKSEAMQSLAESRGFEFRLLDPGIVEMSELKDLVDSGSVVLYDLYRDMLKDLIERTYTK